MGPLPSHCNDESTRRAAAALASRVFFHLEEPRQALRLALESGNKHFDVLRPADGNHPYIECLVNAAIKEYVSRKRMEFDGEEEEEDDGCAVASTAVKRGTREEEEDEDEEELDMSKLAKVMQLMFQWCYRNGSYGHALGVHLRAGNTAGSRRYSTSYPREGREWMPLRSSTSSVGR